MNKHQCTLAALLAYQLAESKVERDAIERFNPAIGKVMSESSAEMMRKTTEDHRGMHISAATLRDLVVGTSTAGGHFVETTNDESGFFDLIPQSMVLAKLGASVNLGMTSNVDLTPLTSDPTLSWVAENAGGSESDPTFGKITVRPKSAVAYVDVSRKLIRTAGQSLVSADGYKSSDMIARLLAKVAGVGLEKAALTGTGTTQPLGLLNNMTGMGAVAIGANGGALTWDAVVDLEAAALTAADGEGMHPALLTNAAIRKTARKNTYSGSANDLWERMEKMCPLAVSNHLPSNLTKGSGTNLSPVIYGNWADLHIFSFGGIEIMVDKYTGATAGTVRVYVYLEADVAIARAQSFSLIVDAS